MTEEMVPNPRRAQLVDLLRQVQSASQEAGQAYQRVYAAMQTGKVWTGPTATAWTDEVGGKHHRLAQLVRQMIHSIEEELHRHPPLVTRSQAELIKRQLTGRS